MGQVKKQSPRQQEKLYERYEKGKISPQEFLDKATDGLFKEKRRAISARHEKHFGKKIL
ncbi:hypothetical protein [Desmospora activa]|uniref:Antitoxin VbhA domain-containing protein n=1 Tax=Desmospora activa DSM 45169 TaxID=1121389 RepID=A0A2T4Z842_9BACL|nr:hypothetical protein [Desmospora activa]PTM58044.1 hypothetical protein C8J48_0616 [Desmospora activa DSM 45169]